MENIKQLFKRKPDIGWGEVSEFKGTAQDIYDAVNILSGEASMSITFSRAKHLREAEEQEVEPTPYREWFNSLKDEQTYRGYMIRTYKMKDGEFDLNISLEDLDLLAAKLLSFHIK